MNQDTRAPSEPTLTEAEACEALSNIDLIWDELFPAEQARIVQLGIERVIVGSAGLDVQLRLDGLEKLAREMQVPQLEAAA